jgi:hypothetical protein
MLGALHELCAPAWEPQEMWGAVGRCCYDSVTTTYYYIILLRYYIMVLFFSWFFMLLNVSSLSIGYWRYQWSWPLLCISSHMVNPESMRCVSTRWRTSWGWLETIETTETRLCFNETSGLGKHIWRFPEIGLPLNIHFYMIFHYKPIHLGYPPFMETLISMYIKIISHNYHQWSTYVYILTACIWLMNLKPASKFDLEAHWSFSWLGQVSR